MISKVALLDFGLARRVAYNRRMTKTGLLLGTPEYMAPEQARGSRELGPPTDIFALGCVLFECLTGQPPFFADNLATVLAKILFGEPPSLCALCPSVPPALEALVLRMLDKDPSRRFAGASELLAALSALESPLPAEPLPAPRPLGSDARAWLSEQRLVAIIMASEPVQVEAVTLDEEEQERADRHGLRQSLERGFSLPGASSAVLLDGSLVVSLQPGPGSATELAERAMACARVVHARWPTARVAVTTGRGQLGDKLPAGEALDRGSHLLRSGALPLTVGAVLIDEVTAGLVGRQQPLRRLAAGIYLLTGQGDELDSTAVLLGSAMPFVGRDHELTVLETSLATCIDEGAPHAVVISGAAGAGKSRLRREFTARLVASDKPLTLLLGRSDPLSTGSPYRLLGQALRRLCGITQGDELPARQDKLRQRLGAHLPPESRPRITEFLAELCELAGAAPVSLQMRTARQAPRVMDDQIRLAFLDWLRAECAVKPLVMIFDDVHYADPASVELLRIALRELPSGAIMLVALVRSESERALPAVFGSDAFLLPLLPLSRRACERLVHEAVGTRIDADERVRIVEQAAGNPLFLEELLRATVGGKGGALPSTVLTMIQVRLERLDSSTRRVLRAASILGERFWPAAVAEILGLEPGGLQAPLAQLVAQEIVVARSTSRYPPHSEYSFRHSLLYDAAYQMLSESEKRAGHRAASLWLERSGEEDPRLLAQHAHRGGDLGRAASLYVRSAEQTAARNDLDGVRALVEQGLACGATGLSRGVLLGLRAIARFDAGDLPGCLDDGRDSLTLLPSGEPRWYRVIGCQVSAAGLLGQQEVLRALLPPLLRSQPTSQALGVYAEAVGAVAMMYGLRGLRKAAAQALEHAAAVLAGMPDADVLPAGALALSHSALINMLEPDPWQALQRAEFACAAVTKAGNRQLEGLGRITLGEALYSLGEQARAEAEMRTAIALGQTLNEPLVELLAQVTLALALTTYGPPSAGIEAEQLVTPALKSARLNPVYRGHGLCALTGALLAQGRLREAHDTARQALAASVACPAYRPRAFGLLMRCLLAAGRGPEALPLAAEGRRLLAELGGCGRTELRFRLAAIEVELQCGDPSRARDELHAAMQQLQHRADLIADPLVRQSFLQRVPTHASLQRLAAEHLVDSDRSLSR